MPESNPWHQPSAAARAANVYYNSLPFEQRQKLAPLLENYRQMGLAEAREYQVSAARQVESRITGIRDA